MDLGLACHACGMLNALGVHSCGRCGTVLAPAAPTSQPGAGPPPYRGTARTVAAPGGAGGPGPGYSASFGEASEAFDATLYATEAGSGSPPPAMVASPPPIPSSPDDGQPQGTAARTLFFGALQQQPVVPRLVVIKGEGGDGATYHLQGATTVIGRSVGDITFSEDPFLSPEHARFTSQTGRLFVQDLESENGVFLRIKKPIPVKDGTRLLVGEQLLELRVSPFSEGYPNDDGTYYYGSPRPAGGFQVVQRLAGGGEGRIATADGNALSMGREGNTLDFPDDRFISGNHARLDASGDADGGVMLTDTGSRNGTFIRIDGAQELFHGDYLFVGQQLLRVEIA